MRRTMTLAALALLFALYLATTLPAAAGDRAANERTLHVPEGWEGAYEFGYAPVVRVGDLVIVSGIPAGGPGSYEEKIRRMYENAVYLLASAGATLDDVVELTTFHLEPKDSPAFRAEFDKYMPIHREFFGEHRPAWTAVGTSALLSGAAPVEMRVIAVVGSGADSRVVRGDGTVMEKAPDPEPEPATGGDSVREGEPGAEADGAP
jgi:enamine deaminase RidA (YjgF/YER057c/UK114 family)